MTTRIAPAHNKSAIAIKKIQTLPNSGIATITDNDIAMVTG